MLGNISLFSISFLISIISCYSNNIHYTNNVLKYIIIYWYIIIIRYYDAYNNYYYVIDIIIIITGVWWYLSVVLICISLSFAFIICKCYLHFLVTDIKHLFMYLLAICISSLEKYLFRYKDIKIPFLTIFQLDCVSFFAPFAIEFYEFIMYSGY